MTVIRLGTILLLRNILWFDSQIQVGPSSRSSQAGPSSHSSQAEPSSHSSQAGPSTRSSQAGPSSHSSQAGPSSPPQPVPRHGRPRGAINKCRRRGFYRKRLQSMLGNNSHNLQYLHASILNKHCLLLLLHLCF